MESSETIPPRTLGGSVVIRGRRSCCRIRIHPEIALEIAGRRGRADAEESEMEEDEARHGRELIRSHNTFLETYLNIHYRFGVSPFRLEKNGAIVTSWFHKVIKFAILSFAMLDIFIKLNYTKAAINVNAQRSNNIEYYVDTIYVASRGLLRATFIYQLVQKKDAYANLLPKMQANDLVQKTHKNKIEWLTCTLCILSILISLLIAILGLDVVHFYILKTSGWSFEDVLLQHEYDIVSAFTKIRIWQENATDHILTLPLPHTGGWTPMGLILGGTGITLSFCAFLLDSAISDMFLATTVMLHTITKEMNLHEGMNVKNMNMAETQTTFREIVKRFDALMGVSEAVNGIVGGLIPFMISVDVLVIVSMLNQGLDGNWSSVLVNLLKLTKDVIGVYLAKTITDEIDVYEKWLVKRHTQDILRLEPNHLVSILHEMSKSRVGIGTGAFFIDEGFIANFLGVSSTYFFIVAEALGENRKQ